MWTSKRAVVRRLSVAAATVIAASGLVAVASFVAPVSAGASTVCGSTTIPYAYHGACATYGGVSGWYGTYGPGFPTADGWVLAGDAASSGAAQPDPTQGYVAGGPLAGGSVAQASALGFALSEAQATDAWTGGGQYSADEEATAGQLLYDAVVWGAATPSLTGGVLAAYQALDGWYEAAIGATGSPGIDMNTTGIGPVPTAGAIYQIRLTFPGSGTSAASFPVMIALSGGYFLGGATSTVTTTDANGYASVEIYADSSSTDVGVTASTPMGTLGLQFYDSSSGGQPVVAFNAPATRSNSETIRASTSESGSGTFSIDEGGDDVAYLGLAGGIYQVIDGQQNVVATLTTDSSGLAGPTQPLPLGTYTVHEEAAPPGYASAADQTVSVVDGGNAIIHFTGPAENLAIPAGLTISDADQQTGVALAGATFEVYYDPDNNGSFSQNVGVCTTGSTGLCSPPPDDLGALIPGNYQVDEVGAPSGYFLSSPGPSHVVALGAGSSITSTFSNVLLGSLQLTKSGNDAAYYGIVGTIFKATGPLPAAGFAGTLTVGLNGNSNVISNLRPGTYTLTETHPPTGYSAVAPFPVVVALGHATTQVNVVDAIDPATLDIYNQQQGTSAPIVGGVFEVLYDSRDSGTYDTDLGRCTTSAIGACSPVASAGLGLLPGRYEVTELSAPPGYAVDPGAPTRGAVLTPGAVRVLDFQDPPLVPLNFAKVPTGNFDPRGVVLSGAVYDVHAGSLIGLVVATCTTDAYGRCSTAASLVSGDSYCWQEVTAPPGFEAGETGCLVADSATGTSPIEVSEPGEYVSVAAMKVAASDPALGLPGALLDLYRMDGGDGPSSPVAPTGSPALTGGSWVASGTSTATGGVSYPLQLPGYAYCVVEATPPAGYELDPTPRCTPVLAGSPVVPPGTTTVTLPDTPLPAPAVVPASLAPVSTPSAVPVPTVTLTAHKYDALEPTSPIDGAVYDLYVVGPAPASELGRAAPTNPSPAGIGGDSWVARSTTDASGNLRFALPSGYAWCLEEAIAPPNFVFDPIPHCTSVLTPGSNQSAAEIELPEVPVMVGIQAHKFNSLQPDTGIPGASYDVYAIGTQAPGAEPPPEEPSAEHVAGDTFYARGVTGPDGELVITVPAGFAWCFKEAHAPPAYRFDPGLHCTAVLESATGSVQRIHLALSEMPKHLPGQPSSLPQLPFTGLALEPVLAAGAALGGTGVLLMRSGRRRDGGERT
ncbi:MAG: cell wall anchor protein [Acidimicrobiaceae bacterium]|nr:cell wall anchor protein [Acidimicrobiaceae bacterium]